MVFGDNFAPITHSLGKLVWISDKILLVVFKSEVFKKDFNQYETAFHLKLVEAVNSPIR